MSEACDQSGRTVLHEVAGAEDVHVGLAATRRHLVRGRQAPMTDNGRHQPWPGRPCSRGPAPRPPEDRAVSARKGEGGKERGCEGTGAKASSTGWVQPSSTRHSARLAAPPTDCGLHATV